MNNTASRWYDRFAMRQITKRDRDREDAEDDEPIMEKSKKSKEVSKVWRAFTYFYERSKVISVMRETESNARIMNVSQ